MGWIFSVCWGRKGHWAWSIVESNEKRKNLGTSQPDDVDDDDDDDDDDCDDDDDADADDDDDDDESMNSWIALWWTQGRTIKFNHTDHTYHRSNKVYNSVYHSTWCYIYTSIFNYCLTLNIKRLKFLFKPRHRRHQLMVNCWFGACWFGIHTDPRKWKGRLYLGSGITWSIPNQQLIITLQGINISHLGKRKLIFKMPGGYVSFQEGSWRHQPLKASAMKLLPRCSSSPVPLAKPTSKSLRSWPRWDMP